MADPARVTIAMAVYNSARTLADAIESIRWQTLPDWKLLLVDDGSRDASLAIARSFVDPRIEVIADGRNLGLATRLNQLVDRTDTPLFARMDADDIAWPRRLEAQLALLDAQPAVDLAGCGVVVIDAADRAVSRYLPRETHEQICADPWQGFHLAHPTWCGRTAWFRKHRYREDYRKTQDQDLLLTAHDSSRYASVPEVLFGYRMESPSLAKRARGRLNFSRSILREAGRRGLWWQAARGVSLQAAKMAVDAGQKLLGLDDWANRRRMAPLGEVDLAAWQAVVERLHAARGQRAAKGG